MQIYSANQHLHVAPSKLEGMYEELLNETHLGIPNEWMSMFRQSTKTNLLELYTPLNTVVQLCHWI